MNQAGWQLVRWIDRFNLTALLNRERRKIGLKAVSNIWKNILGNHVIVASDKEIAAIPPDVKTCCFQTGYHICILFIYTNILDISINK